MLIGLLGIEQRQVANGPQIQLTTGNCQTFGGGPLGVNSRFNRLSIAFDGVERISDVLKSRQHRAAILRRRLFVGRLGRPCRCSSVPPWNIGWATSATNV